MSVSSVVTKFTNYSSGDNDHRANYIKKGERQNGKLQKQTSPSVVRQVRTELNLADNT